MHHYTIKYLYVINIKSLYVFFANYMYNNCVKHRICLYTTRHYIGTGI